MKTPRRIIPFLFLVFLLFASSSWAQSEEKSGTAAVVTQIVEVAVNKGPDDALNRGTPRGSIVGFLEACSNFNFERASEYLDLRNLPSEVQELGGPELARQFNHVVSRAVWFDNYTVSDNPEGLQGDGLPEDRDELVRIKTSEGEVSIWLQRVPRGDGETIWKLSNRSVAKIPELYEEYTFSPPIEKIRLWFSSESSFLGLETFKWFILIVSALLAWPFLYFFGVFLSRMFSSPANENYAIVRQIFTGPLVAIGIVALLAFMISHLGAGAYAQQIMRTNTLITLVLIWSVWSILNLNREHQKAKMMLKGRPGAAKLMEPMTTFFKLLVLLVGSLFWLNNIGVNVSTVLAGLGVGGLALALALQKPIEDMMGALTLFTQVPIRVGDFCRYGDITGTVEDIGLRTTRLRTLTNTLVSIPNSRFASVEIENISARTKIRYWPTLRLRYDTSVDGLQKILHDIDALLRAHEQVHDDPVRVRFTDFDEDAILVKVHCFLNTTDFTEALEIGEDINIQIMEVVESVGAQFALPGKAIYVEGQTHDAYRPS